MLARPDDSYPSIYTGTCAVGDVWTDSGYMIGLGGLDPATPLSSIAELLHRSGSGYEVPTQHDVVDAAHAGHPTDGQRDPQQRGAATTLPSTFSRCPGPARCQPHRDFLRVTQVTLDHYAHFMPEAGNRGRGAIDALFGGGESGDVVSGRNSPETPQGGSGRIARSEGLVGPS
ncbi:hypothetical protein [Streptomyces sp. S465]|uniref:hypothetical protein n=1 Tax=Streptomyces sp. S465 TaxID=2979468 RepID=UPI0022A87E2E|nr:hypothetical protein [Streptomyces sp. S465]WAP54547.1 hypothetical protein N6H00_05865 [Streptomyces sp. S465]